MKIKLQSLDELNLSESFCTIPIIMDRETMIFGAYDVDLNMSESIRYQLTEKCKKKIADYEEHNIKSMIITITDITAFSVSISKHERFKEAITMEEIYENFSENKKIERFSCKCDFPYSDMLVYFQNLGEIHAEFDLEDWICYKDEEKNRWKAQERERRRIREIEKVEPQVIKATEEIKLRDGIEEKVIKQSLLEKMEGEQFRLKDYLREIFEEEKISKENLQAIFLNLSFVLDRDISSLSYYLKGIILTIKGAEELKIEIPEKVKNEIGYWLTDMQAKIRTEEQAKIFEEIRVKLNLKKFYKDEIY